MIFMYPIHHSIGKLERNVWAWNEPVNERKLKINHPRKMQMEHEAFLPLLFEIVCYQNNTNLHIS